MRHMSYKDLLIITVVVTVVLIVTTALGIFIASANPGGGFALAFCSCIRVDECSNCVVTGLLELSIIWGVCAAVFISMFAWCAHKEAVRKSLPKYVSRATVLKKVASDTHGHYPDTIFELPGGERLYIQLVEDAQLLPTYNSLIEGDEVTIVYQLSEELNYLLDVELLNKKPAAWKCLNCAAMNKNAAICGYCGAPQP